MYGTSLLARRVCASLCGVVFAFSVLVTFGWSSSATFGEEYTLTFDFWSRPSYGWGNYSNSTDGQVIVLDGEPYLSRSNEFRAWLSARGILETSAVLLDIQPVIYGGMCDGCVIPLNYSVGNVTNSVEVCEEYEEYPGSWRIRCWNGGVASPVVSLAAPPTVEASIDWGQVGVTNSFFLVTTTGSLAQTNFVLHWWVYVPKEQHQFNLAAFTLRTVTTNFYLVTNAVYLAGTFGEPTTYETNEVRAVRVVSTNLYYARPGDLSVVPYRINSTNANQRLVLGYDVGRNINGTNYNTEFITGTPGVAHYAGNYAGEYAIRGEWREMDPVTSLPYSHFGDPMRAYMPASVSYRINHAPFNPPPLN